MVSTTRECPSRLSWPASASTIDANHVDASYAHVDGGTANAGYLTAAVPVVSVALDCSSLSLVVGATSPLEASVSPDGATFEAVSWSSSDDSVASVSQTGVVTALSAGTATITVTTADGGHTANCEVEVTGSEPVNAITVQPADATAAPGATFTFTVAATGDVASYSWEHSADGGATWGAVSWDGHDTDTLSRAMLEAFDGRMFRYVVTFADGSFVNSEAATLSLEATPKASSTR